MNRSIPDHYVQTLMAELIDGQLTDAQERELLSLVLSDENVAWWIHALLGDSSLLETLYTIESPEYFVRWVLLHTQYEEDGEAFAERVTQAALDEVPPVSASQAETPGVERIKEIAEQQLRHFLEEQEKERRLEESQRLQATRDQQNPRELFEKAGRVLKTSARALVGTAVAAGVLLLIVVGIQYHRSNRVVATLGESVDAQWIEGPEAHRLRPGWLHLEKGYAQVLFTSGVQVLMEGPCAIRLEAPKAMYLDSGTVSFQVPPEAIGFTVTTPSSYIKDFGTEFGVNVDENRASEIHVFVGEVGVRHHQAKKTSLQRLTRGQAALAKLAGSLKLGRISSSDKHFVRRLSELEEPIFETTYLDLADIVGGGNGFGTGQLDQGINPHTGTKAAFDELYQDLVYTNAHIKPVPDLIFVDSVFIPSRFETPMPISQSGLRYDNWPQTKNKCYSAICNGAKYGISWDKIHQGMLQGQAVGTLDYPALRMHTNAGITFDLDAIRTANPDRQIRRFGAYCGMSETSNTKTTAEFWVLVDGVVAFRLALQAKTSTPVNVDIPLNDNARYLTLATTHKQGTGSNWCLFAEPALELVSIHKD